MKRKLGDREVPSAKAKDATALTKPRFDDLGLDARLLQAILSEKYTTPTLVQAKTIPPALQGRDILAKAKTGSGKTAAYVLPILQSVLTKKHGLQDSKSTSALVLVPTRELAEQVHKSFATFSAFCGKNVRSVNITQRISDPVLRSILADSPDVIISTPGKACQSLAVAMFSLKDLQHLVIDEADLVLSYGYENDINNVSQQLPGGVQIILMSATLSTDVETLKGRFYNDPTIIDLEEKDDEGEGVTQYVVRCAEDEKFLLTYVVFKLQLVKGKTIVFVADIDRSYRLKLFLEQFGIKSCVLNSELPVNSRIHVVEEFNKGIYNILIAADDQEILGGIARRPTAQIELVAEGTVLNDDTDEEDTTHSNKRQRLSNKSKDYGVSRGIDFQDVTCVLNFDLPPSSKAYTHRIGRTARAGKSGMALSFVIPTEMYGKHKPTSIRSAKHDEKNLAKVITRQAKRGKEVKPYHFDMKQVDVFRYRMSDALRAVTRPAVREARARELKQELFKSEKLRKHFEERPEDLRHLRHDGDVRAVNVQGHLKHVPDYLMPAKGRRGLSVKEVGFVSMRRTSEKRIRKARTQNRIRGKGRNAPGKRTDPLKSFTSKGRR